jgi:hypothetical protein
MAWRGGYLKYGFASGDHGQLARKKVRIKVRAVVHEGKSVHK